MSLIMTVYLNEGIVMASDSRTTLLNLNQIDNCIIQNRIPMSDATYKSFLAKNNCGISTCGDSSYNMKPIAGYIENILNNNIGVDTTIVETAEFICDYFSNLDINKTTIFHVCGYEKNEKGDFVSKVFRVFTGKNKKIEQISSENNQGAIWNGETLTLAKLINRQVICPNYIESSNVCINNSDGTTINIDNALIIDKKNAIVVNESNIPWEYMSIQDAVDFIKFAFDATINHMQFQSVNKTVGGPVDVLIIKPNSTSWLKRKEISYGK